MMTPAKYLFFIILFLSSAGQLASDVYLPSLPAIAQQMHSVIGLVQLSVSVYMMGYACAQLIYGPLSDGLGRKKPLLVGLLLLVFGSFVCWFSNSISMLIIGRFLQGLGAAGAATIGRVLLFDVYSGPRLVKFNAYLSMAVVVVVAGGPLIGGYIQEHSNWQGNFMFLSVFSVVTLCLCLFLLPETHEGKDASHIKPVVLLANIKRLFVSPFFMGCCLVLLLTYGAILAWLISGPELIQQRLHYSPEVFGWAAFAEGLCFMVGSWVNAQLAGTLSACRLIFLGMAGMVFASILMLLAALITFNFWMIIVPIGIFVGFSSMVFNNIYVIAMQAFEDISGMAGSFLGCVQTLGGGLAGVLVAGLHEQTQMPLAIILMICSIGCVLLFFMMIRPVVAKS